MVILLALLLILLLLNLVVIWRAEHHYSALRCLPAWSDLSTSHPAVSVNVIVPARNEAAVIERCVRSLVNQQKVSFTVTVVDDGSSDATGAIAARAGAQVLRLVGEPPAGWTGKCNACHQAVINTAGQAATWLLFTDADTFHHPDSLRRAVDYAEQHNLAALSLLLKQECGTFTERLVLPLAYQNLFAALDPAQPPFNGQYILIQRCVYEQTGGFAADQVRGRVMEDVALAALLRLRGARLELLNGGSTPTAASVRMYRDVRSLWQGMTKTTFTAARDRGWAGVLLALPFFLGTMVIPGLLIGLLLDAPPLTAAALLNIAVTGMGLLRWLRRFEVPQPLLHALCNPLGVAFLWAVGFVATMRAVLRLGVRWKDRTIT